MAKTDQKATASQKDRRLANIGWLVLILLLGLTLVAESFMHPHPYFGVDGERAFYAWYGFSACVLFILLSNVLGVVLKRETCSGDGS